MISTHKTRLEDYPTYCPLDSDSVLTYLRRLGWVGQYLGQQSTQWLARECGDGNLNLIFIVSGSSGAVVVKQALPYVRMVGESWPLSLRRNFFEHAALCEQSRWAVEFVPAVYHADERMALIAMEFLTPHGILRAGFIGGRIYPNVGIHLGLFLARTLFNTSELRLSGHAKKELMAIFLNNTAMCKISEDLIFDEPYFDAAMNRHTSPQLDSVAASLAHDAELKVAVQAMKWSFTNQPECLIHGDLHTGSVMVTEEDTRVIDPEFACYGPMGFDIGMLIGNFLMAFLAQPGHAERLGDRRDYAAYLLDQLTVLWKTFECEFSTLWQARSLFPEANLCNPRLDAAAPAFSSQALKGRLQRIWHDALGFAGCEMIRRTVGLAHVADFETIADPDRRAECEKRAILLARRLLMERSGCQNIDELTVLARSCE